MNTLITAKTFLLLLLIPGWLTYTDPGKKFTISYPKEWTTRSVNNAIAFLSPQEGAGDTFQENVNVLQQDLSAQPMTLDNYTELSRKQITDAFGANAVVSTAPKSIAGQKGVEMVYTMNYQGRALKIRAYWFIKEKTAWVLTFTAEPAQFDKYDKTGTAILNSFAFIK
jgi:serine/threonine-protein kinase